MYRPAVARDVRFNLRRGSLLRRAFGALVLITCLVLLLTVGGGYLLFGAPADALPGVLGSASAAVAQRLPLNATWQVALLAGGALLALLTLLALLAWWVAAPLRRATRLVNAPDQSAPLPNDEFGALVRPLRAQQAALAQQLADAQSQHRSTVVQLLRRRDVLLQASRELNGVLDSEQLLRRTAVLLTDLFGFPASAAALVANHQLVLYRSAGPSEYPPPVELELTHRTPAGRAALRGAVQRAEAGSELSALETLPSPAVELAVPVLAGGVVLAVLVVQSGRADALVPEHEQDLTTLANQIAGPLANAQRFQGEQARRQLAEVVYRVSQTLSVALAPESVPDLILDQISQALPHDRSALLVLDGGFAEVRATRGSAASRPRQPLDSLPLLKHIAASGRPVILMDARVNGGYRPLFAGPAAVSWLGVPLVQQGRVNGALVLESEQLGRYSEEDALALAPVAAQAAIVVENMRLSARTQELARQLEVVSSVNQLVNGRDGSRGLSGLLGTIIHQIRQVVPCDLAQVALLDQSGEQLSVEPVFDFQAGAGAPSAQLVLLSATTAWASAIRHQTPVEQRDLASSVFEHERDLAQRGLRSAVTVPIVGADRTFGALTFASTQAEPYSHPQVVTLTEISRQLGTMLHNDQLAREREETAGELARSREHLNMVDKVRLVGQLASGVAHDFNNILAGILGNAQLLLLDETDPEQREMLSVIARAAKDGTETVRRIQGFARVQPDDQQTEVQLDLLARDAIDITRPRWRDVALSRGATVEIERLIEPVVPLFGRSGELREVLSNLIINAADALPRGGTITVETRNLTDPAGEPIAVQVVVSDTGTGIPPEVRARIFDPFFTTKGERGTGLGLAVSRSIVEGHGGTIELTSEVGVGTRFVIVLPIHAEAAARVPTVAPGRALPMPPARVLLVEGELMIRAPIIRLLHFWGHQVTAVETADEALRAGLAGRFELVIVDHGLADMSGIELLRRLRLADPALGTVLLTGWGRQTIEVAQSEVIDQILEKPFDQDELRAAVAQVLVPRS